ncbi:superoxide dismutase family protein [Jiella pelagia]|uniref:Superoxide dismutase [Cu-Zn] n=1 Tax=Jiella pelagia TaxID=2986949 RepID=A0ABY7BW95_9HYPH|nr:superoxide dismutase family protein [Jiella pelagia]WAP68107.1 superoxide dismutase family protein [Jiella pelagia]
MGTASFVPTPNGVLIEADLQNLPDGTHGFHIHETGTCEGDFTSAGGHYNPGDREHGYMSENGPHAGDMPNIVAANGSAKVSVFNSKVTMTGGEAPLDDEDGSALMIHSGADDYASQPSGDAGSRIACGVIYPAQ